MKHGYWLRLGWGFFFLYFCFVLFLWFVLCFFLLIEKKKQKQKNPATWKIRGGSFFFFDNLGKKETLEAKDEEVQMCILQITILISFISELL